ncbi:BA75_03494T0 [Komagataella pastoris]|uniref:BA75_03494T0 n=1 Tax=Komagataella pastoris TaxID=4922 RepID=A0A1B2JGA9_PICPA|nr:BA75_03494T0 [Komagataella pastoris]
MSNHDSGSDCYSEDHSFSSSQYETRKSQTQLESPLRSRPSQRISDQTSTQESQTDDQLTPLKKSRFEYNLSEIRHDADSSSPLAKMPDKAVVFSPPPIPSSPSKNKHSASSSTSDQPTANNRLSFISQYSGVVNEVDQIQYIVDSTSQGASEDKTTATVSKLEPETISDTTKTQVPASTDHSDETIKSHVPKKESLASIESAESSKVSGLGILTTITKEENLSPERVSVLNIDPTIPPRSHKRPKSESLSPDYVRIHLTENQRLDLMGKRNSLNIEDQTPKRLSTHSASSKTSSTTPSSPLKKKTEDLDKIMKELQDFQNDNLGFAPIKPLIAENNNSSFSAGEMFSFHTANSGSSSAELSKKPVFSDQSSQEEPITPKEELSEDENDEDYTDIEEADKVHEETTIVQQVNHSTKRKQSKKTKRKHRKSVSSSSDKKRPFSMQTLAKFLSSTDGIIIGNEFEGIGLDHKQRLLLEKAVDSLSRLSVGMVIDPEKQSIGTHRLERAINALDGFI